VKHIFVLTLSDVIFLIFMGLLLLFGLFVCALVAVDRLKRRWKSWRHPSPSPGSQESGK